MGCGISFPSNLDEAILAASAESRNSRELGANPSPRRCVGRVPRGRVMVDGGYVGQWFQHENVPQEQLDCGVTVKVFFTKNGTVVSTRKMALPPDGFYPTIGLLSRGEMVRVDLQPLSG